MTDPVAYLRSRGVEAIRATELGGGVSNRVWLVETPRERLVLKQALGRLRVEEEWLSDRARVFRESAALKALAPCLPAGSVPLVLFEDAREFAFAMTAAGPESANWKDLLLAGDAREDTAETVGRLLARIATATWEKPAWEREFRDQTVFHQLRVDPYYRFTAARHPALASHFERVMAESSARRVCLVHGDWSPKNFLVSAEGVMAIDFEVVHYGDPSFDSAFLLNHFLLKMFYRPQWRDRYVRLARCFWNVVRAALPVWIEPATLAHLPCLMLARVDGKSPAEYLRDPELQEQVRDKARRWIETPPATIDEVLEP